MLSSSITIIGHRGSPSTHPELTLAGFKEAVSAGADALEFDVQVSSDHVPFVLHDPTVNGRVCRALNGRPLSRPIPLSDLTAEEVAQYDCGKNFKHKFRNQAILKDTHILPLSTFLDWCTTIPAHVQFWMELKFPPRRWRGALTRAGYAMSVWQQLQKSGLEKRTVVQSFDHPLVELIKELHPTQRVSYLYYRQTNWHRLAVKKKQECVTANIRFLTAKRLKVCQANAVPVFVWTANSPKQWRQCIDWKVDGIITDYPRALVEFVNKLSKE